MFNLFRSNKKPPAFSKLQTYEFREFYFRRIAQWSWMGEKTIFVIDPNAPRFITMDPWPQKIFMAADGQSTISDYVHSVAKKYRGRVPDLLDATIINEIETLLKEKIIELHRSKMRPEEVNDKSTSLK